MLAFSHTKSAISFNILSVLQIFCRYKWYACRLTYMYRRISKCTDKTPKSIMGGGGSSLPPPSPSSYAAIVCMTTCIVSSFGQQCNIYIYKLMPKFRKSSTDAMYSTAKSHHCDCPCHMSAVLLICSFANWKTNGSACAVHIMWWWYQWRNEPKYLGGHNLCEGPKRPSPRERSDRAGDRGCGRGSFFIFRLENVQFGAYLRRKFGLNDMYYMGKRVTIRPTGKRVCFSWNRKHIYENMHPKIIFAKFQTHANVIPSRPTTLLIMY